MAFTYVRSQASSKASAKLCVLDRGPNLHSVLAQENMMRLLNIVRQYFLHFRNVLLNLCNFCDQT